MKRSRSESARILTSIVLGTGLLVPVEPTRAGSCSGDLNNDGVVDPDDFALFAQCFSGTFNPPNDACPAWVDADLDDDGDVDPGDFAIFSQQFQSTTSGHGCGDCVEGSPTWTNTPMDAQPGRFSVEFDATPNGSAVDGIVGLSQQPGSDFSDFAAMVRFSDQGRIDVRDGGTYRSDAVLTYLGGLSYRVRMVVDVPTSTYDVFVAPPGGVELALARGYQFRTEQAGVSSLSNWGLWAGAGLIEVCGFFVGGSALDVDAGPDLSIPPGGSTVLLAIVTGGQSPYDYAWSPSTGLNDPNIAQPTASPSSTTTYTLTVTDELGDTATDSVVVTVAVTPLTAEAGPNRSISPGGSTTLAGSASGGTAPYTYSWSPSTGLNNPNVAQPTASPSVDTTYTLTVTDSVGASDTDFVQVSILDGDVFYVDGTTGNDSNPGTSSQPWRTLTKAGNSAQAGDTVLVRAGTYSTGLNPANNGTPGNLIVFRAAPGDECEGDVSTFGMESKTGCGVRITGGVGLDRNYIRVEGFEITGSGVDACGVGVEVVNNYVHAVTGSNEWGIHTCYNGSLGADRFSLIENNEVTDINFKGIFAFGEGVVVRGNYVHDLDNDPTKVQGTDILFEFNRLGHAWVGHTDAIEVYEVDGLIIRNNHVWDTTQNIYLSAEDGYIRDVEVLGNVVWCDDYCAAGNNAPGVNCGPNVADITNLRVEGNTFHNVWNLFTDAYAGSPSYRITGLRVNGNIFSQSSLELDVVNAYQADYNLFYQSSLDGASQPHSINANPLFVNVNAFNFRLQAGSPAVNAGIPITGLPTDSDGTSRPQGGAWDIGAYER